MRSPLTLAFLMLVLGLPFSIYAQPQPIRFEHLTIEDGLSQSTVHAIVQDYQGFLWLGTSDGLNRYDGYRFAVYRNDPDDPNSLSDNWVDVLYEDRQQVLWVGTRSGGLNRFDRQTGQFSVYRHDPDDAASLSHNEIQSLHEDHEGVLWVGTNNGLNRFDRQTGQFTRYHDDPDNSSSLSHNAIFALFEDHTGVLWVGTADGLNRFDRQAEQFTRYQHDPDDPASLSYHVVNVLFEDHEGVLWVGTERGLNRFDRQTGRFARYQHDPADSTSLSGDIISALFEDRTGVLWVGTMNGLNRFDRQTGQFTRYRHNPADPSSLANNWVHALYEDRQGVFWVGTEGSGLNRFDRQVGRFRGYRHDPDDSNSLHNNLVWALHEDHQGVLWIGTDDGLNRFDPETGQFKVYLHDPNDPTSLSNNRVWALHEDRQEVLWVGSTNGLNRFDRQTERFTRYRHDPDDPASLRGNVIHALSEDHEDVLWIGANAGLHSFDRQTERFTWYVSDPKDSTSLSHNWVTALYEDSREVLWVGTGMGGLNRFDRQTGRFRAYRHDLNDAASLSDDKVYAIHEDRQGRMWIATGGGLDRFDRQTRQFTHFTEHNSGLPNNVIYGILEDEQGGLWLSTNRGVARFDPVTETVHTYGTDRGLLSEEFNLGAYHESRRGAFFFGGINGFNTFFPEEITDNMQPPQIVLTDFKLFNASVPPSRDGPLRRAIHEAEAVRLAHGQNVIAFEFAGLHFSNPSKNRHTYLLEGFDLDWYEASPERTVTYTNLDPGTYTFRVKAWSAYGVPSEAEASIRVVVAPPWWRTWWAFVLYALMLVTAIYALDRQRRVRLEDRLRAESAEERAKVLQELDLLKTRFFVNVSHEFRTPLTLILGPLHDALGGAFGPLNERLHLQLSIMQRNGARLLRLINQQLDLAKLEAGSMTLRARRADLVVFLQRLVGAFASRAERCRITLQFDAPDAPIDLYFEADKLEKVFVNLLSNAFKFTPDHGKIRVEVASGTDAMGAYAEVAVRDTGQGIAPEDLSHIFDRFHQIDRSTVRAQGGTGIGLALAKELVTLHGGTVQVESREGFGSAFIVRLPQGTAHLGEAEILDDDGYDEPAHMTTAEVAGMALTADDRADTLPREGAPLVLVVEDNADVRAYLRNHLGTRYGIVEAEDGEDGLAKARATPPALVISDVMMPKMDGYELCRALKTDAALNHIPVILLTAKADEESKVEGLETGADDYLYKPFSAAELMVRAENLIEIRRILRQRFSGEVVIGPSEIAVSSAEAVFLEQVRAVVEAHLGEVNFGVDRLADEVDLSVRQLRRRLKAATGLTPGGYLRMMRLERAAQLLAQQVGTVSEIAYAVGFQDARHFAKLFRQVYGVLPSNYGTESV